MVPRLRHVRELGRAHGIGPLGKFAAKAFQLSNSGNNDTTRRHVLEVGRALPGTGLLGKNNSLQLSNSGKNHTVCWREAARRSTQFSVSTQEHGAGPLDLASTWMIEAPLQMRPELVPPLPTLKSEVVSGVWM